METGDRNRIIIRTSIIGIVANILLAAFKGVIGLTANSIAIVMDAVNNISDAGSSVITIIGTKLAGREPDMIQMHGFYIDKAEKTVRFDIVVSFDAKDRKKVYDEVYGKVQKEFPEHLLQIVMDTDFSLYFLYRLEIISFISRITSHMTLAPY